MRRMARKRKNKNIIAFFTIALVVIVFVCSSGYAYFSQRLNLNGTVKLSVDNNECSIHKFNGYNEINSEIEYEIYDSSNGYNVHAMITLTNIGDKYVNAWRSYVVLPEDIIKVSSYNCEQVYESNKAYIFENPNSYNSIIEQGKSITYDIQYQVAGNDYQIKDVATYGFNTNIERIVSLSKFSGCLNGGSSSDDEMNGSISASYANSTNWSDSSYIYYDTTITIINNYAKTVDNWYIVLELGNEGSIPGCWNATCKQNGSKVTITQPSWKNAIPAGGSIDIAFQIKVPKGYQFSIVETGLLF